MFHAECKVRPLEYQDEMTVEPHSKKMKSKEEIYAKLCDDDFQGSHEKTGTQRTSNDLIPSSISDNQDKHEAQKQENETTVDLELSNEVTLYYKPMLIESTDSENIQNTSPSYVSKNDAEITKNNCTSETDYLDKSSVKEESNKSFEVSDGEVAIEEFSTSKAFIGPIYKTENKQDKTKDYAELSTGEGEQNALLGRRTEEERVKKTKAISCDKEEIDDELYRFYEEIQQIETNKDNLGDNLEETESQSSQEQYTERNYKQTSCGQGIWYTSTQSHYGNQQYFSNEQSGQRTGNEQCFENETNSQRIDNEQHFGNQTSGWRTENPSNGQEDYPEPEKVSNFWNFSVPQCRPAWQSTQSFIVPQGPLPPRFSHHLDFQTIRSSPHQPNTFHPHDVQPSHKKFPDYHGNNSHVNWNHPLSAQNCRCVGNIDIHNIQVSRNGYSDKDIPVNDRLSETREDCWKDTKTYQTKGEHSFSFQQFPEEKLCGSQKLLLILRGLPGSGKTTVSCVLLGQSRDGVVFSTDDYFNQQDGYTYNAGQLGDAHDWNQKRARQAMEQGKSPIIIDNTNTQAWEMKPYVEMALEKGYIVEFREPDTWWKFDPEELEKRNKHGVTREKIAQMLDRYEYQISIPIVMNSVTPPHKSTQRPPPQRRQRETDLKKKLGHRVNKTKQRKKRKRGKKQKNSLFNIRERKSDGAPHHLIPADQETSESEEEDSEEENRKSACTFNGDAGDPIGGCEDGSTGDDVESIESTNLKKEGFPFAVSETSATFDNPSKNNLLAEDKNPLLINSTSFSNDNITEHTADAQLTDENQNKILLEKENNSLKKNYQNSIITAEHSSDDYNTVMLNTEDKCKSGQITCGPKENLSHLYDLKESETSIVLSDKNINDKHISKSNRNYSNAWAFFSINLGDEQLQLDSDRQTSLSAWPESTHKFICEQRPKKVRTPKQTYSDDTVELAYHHSNEEIEKQSSQQTFNEEIVSVPRDSLSSLIDRRDSISFQESQDTSTSSFHEVNSEYAPAVPKKKTRKRILKLAPNFNIPRHIAISTEEGQKDVPLQHDRLSESILEMKQKKVFNKKNGERDDQIFKIHELQPSSNNDELIESSPNCYVKSLLPDTLYDRMGQSGASSVQKFPNSLCIVSSTTEEEIPPVKQQKICDKKEGEQEQVSSEVTTSHPDILSSVKVISECSADCIMFESCGNGIEKTEPPEVSQIEDKQDSLDAKSNVLDLPLSLGFAFQLVQLFGSPGVPLESLLPDDYIVPLDWKVSKMIYFLWKTSVEEKQKKNGFQNGNSLVEISHLGSTMEGPSLPSSI